jgi:hypothetical protein
MPANIYSNGIKAGWSEQEGGWATDMNNNLVKLNYTAIGGAIGIVGYNVVPPAIGSDGVGYIKADGNFAVWDGPSAAYIVYSPKAGWKAFDTVTNKFYFHNGAAGLAGWVSSDTLLAGLTSFSSPTTFSAAATFNAAAAFATTTTTTGLATFNGGAVFNGTAPVFNTDLNITKGVNVSRYSSTLTGADQELLDNDAVHYVLTGAGLVSINSIWNSTTAQMICLSNKTGGSVVLKNMGAGAAVGKKIRTGTGADYTLINNESLMIIKDIVADEWLCIGLKIATTSNIFSTVVLNGLTSGAATLQAAAVTTPYSLTLPPTAGTAGQALTTNGAGVASWSTISGSVSTVEASYYANASVAYGASVPINFNTVISDSGSRVTTGAAWRFTSDASRKYLVNVNILVSAGVAIRLHKNGVFYSWIAYGVTSGAACGFIVIDLVATDYIDFRLSSGTTVAGGAFNTDSSSRISIIAIG